MITAINQSGWKKAVICLLMVVLIIMVQCVCPMIEAHAVAIAAGAVAAAAIAALLVMIGVKILPTTNVSLSKIYADIVRVISENKDNAYNTILDLWGKIAVAGVKIGDKIKILSTALPLIKQELLRAIGVSIGLTNSFAYTGGNILLSDVNIVNSDKIINYEQTESANWNLGNNPTFRMENGQTSLISCRMAAYSSSVNYFMANYIKLRRNDGIGYYRIYIVYYGIGKYSNEIIYDRTMESVGGNKIDDTKPLYVKFAMVDDNDCLGFIMEDGAYGLTSDRKIKICVFEDDNMISETQLVVNLYSMGPKNFVLQTSKDAQYKITGTKYEPSVTVAKAKVIPGVGDVTIDVANGNVDQSIDVTLPDTLTPDVESVCPDLKIRLDQLNPAIDYDTDIQTHTWDEATNSELPDEVDGSIEGEGTTTGEVDLGEVKDMPDQEDLELPAIITDKFPFSIPWDVKRAVECLVAAPEVPVFRLPFKIDSINYEYEIEIDLSQFEAQAAVCRWFVTMIVCIGLIMATRKLIGQ